MLQLFSDIKWRLLSYWCSHHGCQGENHWWVCVQVRSHTLVSCTAESPRPRAEIYLEGERERERERGRAIKNIFLELLFPLSPLLSLAFSSLSFSLSLALTHTQVSRGPLGLEPFEYVSVFSPDEPLASPVLAQMKSSGFYRHINLQLHWEEEERVTGK